MPLWDSVLWDGSFSSGGTTSAGNNPGNNPRIGLFPQVQIFWDNGGPFNGFCLVGLIPPILDAVTYLEGDFGLAYPTDPLPQFAIIPIINGYFNGSVGLYYNEDISPPNTTYNARFYDTTKRLIAGPSPAFTVASNPIDSIPSPSLPIPQAGGTPPSPD